MPYPSDVDAEKLNLQWEVWSRFTQSTREDPSTKGWVSFCCGQDIFVLCTSNTPQGWLSSAAGHHLMFSWVIWIHSLSSNLGFDLQSLLLQRGLVSCWTHEVCMPCPSHVHLGLLRQSSSGGFLLKTHQALGRVWTWAEMEQSHLEHLSPECTFEEFFLQKQSQEEKQESRCTRVGQKHLDKTFLHWNVLAHRAVLWRQFDCSQTLPRNCQTYCLAILRLPLLLSSCLGHGQQPKSLESLQAPGLHSVLHEKLSSHGWPGFWLQDRAARGVA